MTNPNQLHKDILNRHYREIKKAFKKLYGKNAGYDRFLKVFHGGQPLNEKEAKEVWKIVH